MVGDLVYVPGTSKDVCHVQGRIEGIKNDVEIAGFTSGHRVSV